MRSYGGLVVSLSPFINRFLSSLLLACLLSSPPRYARQTEIKHRQADCWLKAIFERLKLASSGGISSPSVKFVSGGMCNTVVVVGELWISTLQQLPYCPEGCG